MTPEEIRKLHVGDAVVISDMDAEVDAVYRKLDNEHRCYVMFFEGHFKCFEKLADGGFGWVTTDSPEANEEFHLLSLDEIHFKNHD
jgi:hypothetical protein